MVALSDCNGYLIIRSSKTNKLNTMETKKLSTGYLASLRETADASRARVSGYSDEKRSDLEDRARAVIKHVALPAQVRRA
jgi:hypothetical protein